MHESLIPEHNYSDPWNIPLAARLTALIKGRLHIAYFYEEQNNSSFRYRAYNMAQVLNENAEDISASYFFLNDLHEIDNIVKLADLLVVCRSRYCHRLAILIQRFKAKGKSVLFDVDDLVFDTRYTHLIIRTLGLDPNVTGLWDSWFAYISRISEAMRLCDRVITTNEFLAKKVEEILPVPVSVVPNFMNKEQLKISDAIFSEKNKSAFKKNETTCFGYFSGSPTHFRDFSIATNAIETILESDPNVELIVAGFLQIEQSLRRFGDRVRYEPFRDYVNLQRLIGSVEYNLMPLQQNAFTNCKSPLKFFEASAVGTLSIASPSINYAGAIEDGVTGLLAKDYEWESKIRQVLDSQCSYSDHAHAARNKVLSEFTFKNQRMTILNALGIS